MLREFVEKKHYLFAKEAKDWEDAIIMSCKSLEADGTVEHCDAAFPGGCSRSQ